MAKRISRKPPTAPAAPFPLLMALGPLAYLRRSWKLAVLLLLLCGVLTGLTQVGGAVLWLSTPAIAASARRLGRWSRIAASFEAVTVFLLIYGLVSLLAVPPLAALGGRAPLPCFGDQLKSRSPVFCALNRHYVRRDLRTLAEDLGEALARTHPGARLRTLDAGFPFLDGFPLLPHLSHRNGTAMDLALFYTGRDGRPASSPSPLGYWAYAGPRAGEVRPCEGKRSRLRWDLELLQGLGRDASLDEDVTRDALRWLSEQPTVERIFIEPHLRERLGLRNDVIGFQGCGAARHDDHIHVQIKR